MTSQIPLLRGRLAPLCAALMVPTTLSAQAIPSYPALSEIDPVEALSRYLRMLAANPRDLASLTGAGRAALAVGDANAALGFYARAEEISPRNGRIKAGLASALVQMEEPRTALRLFDEAVALGVSVGEIAPDRGLAHDLNGDSRSAQADYALALRSKQDDETIRRLALSLAISGDRAGALMRLDPLLRRNDGGAIRARAFVLALTGDQAGAAKAVQTAMPGPQATVMANFLSRLVKLNPAQKALAVNFGYFPSDGRADSAAELFADARSANPATATMAPMAGGVPAIGGMGGRDTSLIPAGPPLGQRLAGAAVDPNALRRRPGEIAAGTQVAPPAHVLAAPVPGRSAVPVPPASPIPSPPATPPLGARVASNSAVTLPAADSFASVLLPRRPRRRPALLPSLLRRALLRSDRRAAPPAPASAAVASTAAASAAPVPAGPAPSSPIATASSTRPLITGSSAAAATLPPVASAPASSPLREPKATAAPTAVASADLSPAATALPVAPTSALIASAPAPALAPGTTTPSAAPSPSAMVPAIATVELPASTTSGAPLRAETVVAAPPLPLPVPPAAPALSQLAAIASPPPHPVGVRSAGADVAAAEKARRTGESHERR